LRVRCDSGIVWPCFDDGILVCFADLQTLDSGDLATAMYPSHPRQVTVVGPISSSGRGAFPKRPRTAPANREDQRVWGGEIGSAS